MAKARGILLWTTEATMYNSQQPYDVRRRLHSRGICVIIPTFNNAGTIARVVAEAQEYCDDVFVVDDGSDDGTSEILKETTGIHLVAYERNRGKGHALKEGFTAALKAGFAYAITMDADGQHSAKNIPDFLNANIEHPGCLILGKRKLDNIVRSKGSVFANNFSNFWFAVQTLQWQPDTQTGFRLYPLKKLYGYKFITSRYEAELELIVFAAWHGVKIHSIPVDVYYPPKEERVSHFRPGPDFARISVLNTVLCVFALIYGLPLFIIRKALAALRTVATYLLLALVVAIFWPTLFVYVKCGKLTERKKWRLHVIIYNVARFVVVHIGIPGAKYSCHIAPSVDFNKPSVIISNHQSHLDLIYMLALTPRLVFLTNSWVWHSPLYGFLIHAAEYYPSYSGIDTLVPNFRSLAERGYTIAIFPEGTRSADCRIARFHEGAFYIAEQLGLGITPAYLYGTGHVLPKKKHTIRKWPVALEVDKTITPDELKALGSVRKQTKALHQQYLSHYEELSDKTEQNA